jgi:hypothetical protein
MIRSENIKVKVPKIKKEGEEQREGKNVRILWMHISAMTG